MPTCRKCHHPFPNWVPIEGKLRNLTSRKFCLDCSPFGEHNTRDLTLAREVSRSETCLDCRVTLDETNSYRKPQSTTFHPYCKHCFNAKQHERQKRIKWQCIEYRGNCCAICGYNRCRQALEFHHLQSETKEREISGMKSRSFERLKPELDKCILLCSNCHRELHAGIISLENAIQVKSQQSS